MTISYIVALFLFALIVGQMRNIIGSLSTKQDAFLIVLDTTIKHCKNLNLPNNIMKKVVLWFDFYSKQQDDSRNIYLKRLKKLNHFKQIIKNISKF